MAYDPNNMFGFRAAQSRTGNTGTSSISGNPFGSIPTPISVAPNTYSQVSGVMPQLPQLTQSAGNVVGDELAGKLSPSTISSLRDAAATYGVTMGVPGSQFQGYDWLRSLGLNAEEQRSRGLHDFNSLLSTTASTQTNPELATNVADRNSVYAAAPNPADAASYAQSLFDKYLAEMRSPAGGTIPMFSPDSGASNNDYSGSSGLYGPEGSLTSKFRFGV